MKRTISLGAKLRFTMLALLMLTGITPAFAWDGVVTGTVHAIEVTGGNNYGFRVYLTGVTNMCGAGTSTAFLNESDSNYKTYVAGILTAKAQGTPVVLYTTLASASLGLCQIGYVTIL